MKKKPPKTEINLELQLPSHSLVLYLDKIPKEKIIELQKTINNYCKYWKIK